MGQGRYTMEDIWHVSGDIHLMVYRDTQTDVNSCRFVRIPGKTAARLTWKQAVELLEDKDASYEEAVDCVSVFYSLQKDAEDLLDSFCREEKLSRQALETAVSRFLCDPANSDLIEGVKICSDIPEEPETAEGEASGMA